MKVCSGQDNTGVRQEVQIEEQGRGAQEARVKDCEDEKEEPVKRHARCEEGHMPASSWADPMPTPKL